MNYRHLKNHALTQRKNDTDSRVKKTESHTRGPFINKYLSLQAAYRQIPLLVGSTNYLPLQRHIFQSPHRSHRSHEKPEPPRSRSGQFRKISNIMSFGTVKTISVIYYSHPYHQEAGTTINQSVKIPSKPRTFHPVHNFSSVAHSRAHSNNT